MRSARFLLALTLLEGLLLGASPHALAMASLQVTPQKYEDTLIGDKVRSGFVDVSNPGDATVTVRSSVQGFRQADLDGNLEFFTDPTLTAAITPGLAEFDLGPRQAIRVTFTVDPAKLPQGGVYAAIFFKTVPPKPDSAISYIAESANVGTLLILQNGALGTQTGQIARFTVPWLQIGSGINGAGAYTNTNRDVTAVAFAPKLTTQITPWGKLSHTVGPFVLPQSTREFTLQRQGSYLGILPITLADTGSGKAQTRWVVAMTGWYAILVPLALVLLLFDLGQAYLRRFLKARRKPVKRPMDGLSAKPKK